MSVDEGAQPRPRRRRRTLRVLLVAVLVLVVAACGAAVAVSMHLAGQMGRVPGAFDGLKDRPAGSRTLHVLLVVDDTSTRTGSWLPGHGRGVSMMVVAIPPDHSRVQVSVVPLDATAPGSGLTARQTLTGTKASASVGFAEQVTGVRVDHLLVARLSWVQHLADRSRGLDFGHGWVSPAMIVGSFGSATGAPGQQLDDQVHWFSALLDTSLHQEFKTHPGELWDFVDQFTQRSAVERGWSTWSMARLAFSLRDLRSAHISFRVVPTTCTTGCVLRSG